MVCVSIIVPLFDKGEYLEETIRSVQMQTVAEWEMLIVDNLSTDQGPEIARHFAAGDHRIQVVECYHARGPGAARNVGLDLARGKWVLFLDADDLLAPPYLEERLATSLSNPTADIIVGSWQEFSADGPEAERRLRRPAGWGHGPTQVETSAIIVAPWAVHAAIVRRTHLDLDRRWPEDFDRAPSEDSAFWFPVVLNAQIAWSPGSGALYRTATPTSRNANRDRKLWFDAFQSILKRNTGYLRRAGKDLSATQCLFLVRLFEQQYHRASKVGDIELASLTLESAREWLSRCPAYHPAMILRRFLGFDGFFRLRCMIKKSHSWLQTKFHPPSKTEQPTKTDEGL